MTRRKRGEGSITRRADGRYMVRVPLDRDALGKRQRLTDYADTDQEALRVLARLQRERYRREVDAVSLPKLFGPTVDMFLEHVKLHREPNTYRIYESVARLHVKPALGHHARARMTSLMVQQVIDAKLKAGYKPNTVRSMWTLVTAVLSWAQRHGGEGNVASSRVVEVPAPESATENIMDLAEARGFLAAIEGDRLYALFLAAVALGQREGSLLGLTWPDIAEDYGRIRLPRRLVRVEGAWQLRPTTRSRTKKSPRSLPLPVPVAEALREHRVRQAIEREQAGPDWSRMEHNGREVELVFTMPHGQPMWASTVAYRFERCLEKAGLRRRRFHDLRHSAASIMLALRIPLEVVSEVLAHAGIQITADLYNHLKDDGLREQLAILDAAWGKKEATA